VGIDIHAHIELKFDDGSVKYIGKVDIIRRRYLYYFMGCGSDDVEPVSESKGFPPDLSEKLKYEYENRFWEGYSESWLSIGEFEEVRRRYISWQDEPIEGSVHVEGVKPIAQLESGATSESENNALEEIGTEEDVWQDEALDVKEIIETMQLLTVHGTPRLVFWFDN
jgi:hypothetical protein